ncbi:MAG: DUF1501 domain-containing protein [Bryobacteraceae bacterium]
MHRRAFLNTVANGFGLFGLSHLLAREAGAAAALAPKQPHFTPRAKRVIFLFLNGGLSHVDSFDPKPALEKYHGKPSPIGNLRTERKTGNLMASPFSFRKYGRSGMDISDLFPRVAGHADKLCVIRSMHTDIPNHPPALVMMNCGRNVIGAPSFGSWITYGLGTENRNLPGYVVLCPGKPNAVGSQLWSSQFLPGVFQGTHIQNDERATDPEKLIPFLHSVRSSGDAQRKQVELLQQMNRDHFLERSGDAELEASIQSMEIAYRMQAEATDAFDLRKERPQTLERYGDSNFGRGCLLARRLIERGVRTAQVFFEASDPWDHHADIMMHQRLAAMADPAIAALLSDLESAGLLEETLVLVGSEFGRTPTAEVSVRQFLQNGRDHNPYGFTMFLAGGGVKGGYTHGATDEWGWKAIEKPVHVHDLHATMLHLLGFDHTRLTYHSSGRDFRLTDVEGVVVKEILT